MKRLYVYFSIFIFLFTFSFQKFNPELHKPYLSSPTSRSIIGQAIDKDKKTIKQPYSCAACGLENLQRHSYNPVSFTGMHLRRFYKEYPFPQINIEKKYPQSIVNSKVFSQFIRTLDRAQKLQNQGYYSFFHGQEHGYALLNDIGTKLLYQLAEIKKRPDFNFLRLRKKDFEKIGKSHDQVIEEWKEEQRSLMKNTQASGMDEELMALNLFAFGNMSDRQANTYSFILNKKSLTRFTMGRLTKMLQIFSISLDKTHSIYTHFKELLDKENSLYTTGRLILVSLPINLIDERLFGFSFQYPVEKPLSLFIEKIIHLENQNPSSDFFDLLDHFHCVMPLTPAGALNPYNDIKIMSFDSPLTPPQQQELEKDKDRLVDEIIEELQKEGKLEEMRKKAKEYFMLLKETHEKEEGKFKKIPGYRNAGKLFFNMA